MKISELISLGETTWPPWMSRGTLRGIYRRFFWESLMNHSSETNLKGPKESTRDDQATQVTQYTSSWSSSSWPVWTSGHTFDHNEPRFMATCRLTWWTCDVSLFVFHSQKAAEFYLLLSVTIVLECFRLFYLFVCDSFEPFEWQRCDTNFIETELWTKFWCTRILLMFFFFFFCYRSRKQYSTGF